MEGCRRFGFYRWRMEKMSSKTIVEEKLHKLGFVEDASIQPFLFNEQYNTFQKLCYATDPSGQSIVGDLDTMERKNAMSIYNIPQ